MSSWGISLSEFSSPQHRYRLGSLVFKCYKGYLNIPTGGEKKGKRERWIYIKDFEEGGGVVIVQGIGS